MDTTEAAFGSSHWVMVHLAGGGQIKLAVGMSSFLELADALDRRRSLLGQVAVNDGFGGEVWVPALIPAARVNMVLGADDVQRQ